MTDFDLGGHDGDLAGISLRPCVGDDEAFLFQVYAASRAEEMAQIGEWTQQQRDEFLRFQFRAQHQHYHEHYPRADYLLILLHHQRVGRLYVDVQPRELRLMDIALLTAYRNRGIGRVLVEDILRQATAEEKFVSLHVEQENPAKRLYERLGFRAVADVSFYKLMHWHPEDPGDRAENEPGHYHCPGDCRCAFTGRQVPGTAKYRSATRNGNGHRRYRFNWNRKRTHREIHRRFTFR